MQNQAIINKTISFLNLDTKMKPKYNEKMDENRKSMVPMNTRSEIENVKDNIQASNTAFNT